MARLARVVVPGVPHHVTQRGNRGQPTFFESADYELYKRLVGHWCRRQGVTIWAYCLMPNHVHLVLCPRSESALARAVGEAHRRYTLAINYREGWKGFLWQGRFASFPMGDTHLLRAVRYVLLNPVAAGLVASGEDWPYSSARAHLRGRSDGLVTVEPLARCIPDWATFLAQGFDVDDAAELELHQRTGRPLGDTEFLARAERTAGRSLRPGTRGRKPRGSEVQPIDLRL
jgi:putative transposase